MVDGTLTSLSSLTEAERGGHFTAPFALHPPGSSRIPTICPIQTLTDFRGSNGPSPGPRAEDPLKEAHPWCARHQHTLGPTEA